MPQKSCEKFENFENFSESDGKMGHSKKKNILKEGYSEKKTRDNIENRKRTEIETSNFGTFQGGKCHHVS